MNIVLITPSGLSSRSGNRTTAHRWARILRELGHRVRIAASYDGAAADAMIALHAVRSAASICRFRASHPRGALIVALTGTDIYNDSVHDAGAVARSLALADRLVALQNLVRRQVPPCFRKKLRIIHQSAAPLPRNQSVRRAFDVAVIGHLRDVKDPLRAALAARQLPASSRLRVIHAGGANKSWAKKARAEMNANPRYIWRGDLSGAQVRRLLGRVKAIVLSSLLEGGANVVSEAVAAGVPVLASRIDGSVGLLGRGYPGYFPAGDTAALAKLLNRIETEPRFLAALRRAVARRAFLFKPSRETAAWRSLLRELRHS